MNNKRQLKKKKDREPKSTSDHHDALNVLESLNTEEKRWEYINLKAIQRTAPKPTANTNTNAAMDGCDGSAAQYQASFENANPHLLSYFIASSSFIGYYACALIAQHWLVAKGCEIKAKDAVKKGYDLSFGDGTEIDSKQIKRVEALDKKYKLKKNMFEGVKFRNIFGIRHILFKHTDPNFDYEKPFNADSFRGGKYAGISQIDPYWITPEFDNADLVDPAAIGFYEPTFWLIQGNRYHKSHFVVLLGDEVSDYLKPTYRYGGIPLTQKIYERVYAAERTANEAPQLAMTKRLQVRKTDLAKAQANKSKFVANLQTANEFRDNYGVTVVGKDEEINQLETSLADLDNLIMTQYQLACSIIGAPSTEIMGVSPKGFSTGESDSDNYIEDVEEEQGNDMTEIAEAHYARLIPSTLAKEFGISDLEIDINWRPIKVMSEKEIADTNFSKSQSDMAAFNTGAIDNIDIRQRLVNDKQSGYSGLGMPTEIIETEGTEIGEEV